jgi:hypothetical protein
MGDQNKQKHSKTIKQQEKVVKKKLAVKRISSSFISDLD